MTKAVMITALFALFTCTAWAGNSNDQNASAKSQELNNAAHTLQQISNSKEIPRQLVNEAQCIAAIPNMTKAGFIAGGEHGNGVVSCRGNNGWSAPAFFSISGGSLGLQAGAQQSKIVLLMNQQGEQELFGGNVKLSAKLVAAGPTSTSYNKSAGWTAPVLAYKISNGLYAGAEIQGSTLSMDTGAIHKVYGANVSARDVLDGHARVPQQAAQFMRALHQAV